MRGGVAEGAAALLVLEGEDFHRAVPSQRGAQVHGFAVHPGGAGRTVKAHGNVAAESFYSGVFRHLADIAALESDVQHGHWLLSKICCLLLFRRDK